MKYLKIKPNNYIHYLSNNDIFTFLPNPFYFEKDHYLHNKSDEFVITIDGFYIDHRYLYNNSIDDSNLCEILKSATFNNGNSLKLLKNYYAFIIVKGEIKIVKIGETIRHKILEFYSKDKKDFLNFNSLDLFLTKINKVGRNTYYKDSTFLNKKIINTSFNNIDVYLNYDKLKNLKIFLEDFYKTNSLKNNINIIYDLAKKYNINGILNNANFIKSLREEKIKLLNEDS